MLESRVEHISEEIQNVWGWEVGYISEEVMTFGLGPRR